MISSEHLEAIRRILGHDVTLRPILDRLGEAPLRQEEKDRLREALLDVLCDSGLRDDDEPNAWGIVVENLIDEIDRA